MNNSLVVTANRHQQTGWEGGSPEAGSSQQSNSLDHMHRLRVKFGGDHGAEELLDRVAQTTH